MFDIGTKKINKNKNNKNIIWYKKQLGVPTPI